MLLYRIEDNEGLGPYIRSSVEISKFLRLEMGHSKQNYSEHPSPISEGLSLSRDGAEWHCCFRSLRKLLAWFAGCGEKLEKGSFLISVYSTPRKYAQHGYYQSVFVKDQSKLISKREIKFQ